jgi:hypothetical protein
MTTYGANGIATAETTFPCNLSAADSLLTDGGEVIMANNKNIPVSRNKKQEFLSLLGRICGLRSEYVRFYTQFDTLLFSAQPDSVYRYALTINHLWGHNRKVGIRYIEKDIVATLYFKAGLWG